MTSLVLPRSPWEGCVGAAGAKVPFEEGGLLLGHVDAAGHRLVTHAIGSGPGARRERTWLEVDHDWQNARIRELHKSGERVAYLGEWHSHPDATSGTPSRRDRRTLERLAAFGPLACPDPVMAIVYPAEEGWRAQAWALARPAARSMRLLAPPVRSVDIIVRV